MKQVYLFTGPPGAGKTSLIKQALAEFGGRAGGFYTEEIRSQGVRKGFRLVTLEGQQAIFAHVDIQSLYRVAKYGVDTQRLDQVGISALRQAAEQCQLVIIDEIGKMELFSASFRETVLKIINSGKRLLGTIMLSSSPWTDAIKHRPEVNLVEVTRVNHRQILEDLRHWLRALNEDRD